jgi:hypothetical protein
MKEVLEYFMKHGKTEEEERRDLLQRLQVHYLFLDFIGLDKTCFDMKLQTTPR